jgi:hypothetical protein
MTEKEIIHIVHIYFQRLKQHFRVVKKNTTAETIKPFRIEIKKLRAFLRLLDHEINDHDKIKLPGSLKEMHKSGGRFRDLQLHQQRIEDAIRKRPGIQFSHDLVHAAQKEIRKERTSFLSHKHIGKPETKLKEHLPKSCTTATVRDFFRAKLDHIATIIEAAKWSDKEMHDIRKKLKDILYIIKLYQLDLKKPLGFRFWSKAELQKAKDLEDQLGFLNDTRNALLILDTAMIKRYQGEEKKLLQSLRRALLVKKTRQKKEVIVSLDGLVLDKP